MAEIAPWTDADWVRALEECRVTPSAFSHERHLQVAFACLQASDSVEAATARMRAALRQFVSAAGLESKYHETLTVFWMNAVAGARAATPEAGTWEALRAAHPELLDTQAPLASYTAERLFSDEARTGWCAPDRKTGAARP